MIFFDGEMHRIYLPIPIGWYIHIRIFVYDVGIFLWYGLDA